MATHSSPDLEDNALKRRARRRLIGSIALVLVAVIVLPMVFDEEKKPLDQDVSVQIPNQDVVTVRTPSGNAAPKVVEPREPKGVNAPSAAEKGGESPVVPKAEDKPSEPAKSEAKAPAAPDAPRAPETRSAKVDAKPEPRPEAKSAAKPEARSEAKKPAEEARVKAILDDQPPAKAGQFAVQVGAFAADDKIREAREKLGSAGFRSYTEKLETKDGERTRVRAGPFPGREAAEAARDRIRALGYANAAVVAQ